MLRTEDKKIIAVDIDDVLAANAEGFVEFCNQRWGTNLKVDDYTEHWADLCGVDTEEESRRRNEIVVSKLFTRHRVFEEAKQATRLLARKYKLVIVSSRGPSVQKDSIEWLNKEFNGLFEEFYFLQVWEKPISIDEKLGSNKNELLEKAKASYLIDDQPKHCTAAAEAGITSLVFGDYKWNRHVQLLPKMVRTKSWQEVLEYFDAQD